MMPASSNKNIEWHTELYPDEWDSLLKFFSGHPLQSALWGMSRYEGDQISDMRWLAKIEGQPCFMARIECRQLFRWIKIAWIPKGPIYHPFQSEINVHLSFLKALKQAGFWFCITNPYIIISKPSVNAHHTRWINLTEKAQLWKLLKKNIRNEILFSQKHEITCKESRDEQDIQSFFLLCDTLSKKKKFKLGTSFSKLKFLIAHSNKNIQSHLFLAYQKKQLCGGAFIIGVGEKIHYLWGAIDHEFAKYNVGLALQWHILQWGVDNHYHKYDLGGIDLKKDPGNYLFKKKLGGETIHLSGHLYYPLKLICKLCWPLLKPLIY